MVPLQHNILLSSVYVLQTNAIESMVSLTLDNNGTSKSPSGVVVSFYVSGQPEFSTSTSTLISSVTLPEIESSDSYLFLLFF